MIFVLLNMQFFSRISHFPFGRGSINVNFTFAMLLFILVLFPP